MPGRSRTVKGRRSTRRRVQTQRAIFGTPGQPCTVTSADSGEFSAPTETPHEGHTFRHRVRRRPRRRHRLPGWSLLGVGLAGRRRLGQRYLGQRVEGSFGFSAGHAVGYLRRVGVPVLALRQCLLDRDRCCHNRPWRHRRQHVRSGTWRRTRTRRSARLEHQCPRQFGSRRS